MLLLVNNLHEKRITESQDGRNFGSERAICNWHSCCNFYSCYMKMESFSPNQTLVVFSCICSLFNKLCILWTVWKTERKIEIKILEVEG